MRIVLCSIIGTGTDEDPFRPDTTAKHWQAPLGVRDGAVEELIEEFDDE